MTAKTPAQKAVQKERSNAKKKRNIIKQIAKGVPLEHEKVLRKRLNEIG